MKVLISGASGFVGQNLLPFLSAHNFETTPLSRKQNQEHVNYETLSSNYLSNYYAFVHLAGKAHDLKNASNDQEYFEVNTELTKRLFDKFIDSDCSVFVFLSSVKAVADTVSGVLTEDHIPNPKTAYGKSKLEAEKYILSRNLPEHKRVYVLRPCMIHGPKNKGNLNLLYAIVSKGMPYPLAAFDNKRSFVHVDTLSRLILELINKRPLSTVFNVSDDYPLSTTEVVQCMYEVEGNKPKLIAVPKKIIKSLAKLGDVFKLPLTSERLDKLTENYVVSNKKIKEALKLSNEFDTRKGLVHTIKSFKK